MKKIALISDTHDVLRDDVLTKIKGCDYILHAGDVTSPSVIETLKTIAPMIVVRGNNDASLENIPYNKTVSIHDVSIYMTHQYMDIPNDLKDIQIVIYGHSHKYDCYNENGITYINPGSCGRKRFSLPLTMAYLYIDKGTYTIEKIDIF
ncbi:MAG: metallophosphoesterase family protein [Coprobacillaceae bacterium]